MCMLSDRVIRYQHRCPIVAQAWRAASPGLSVSPGAVFCPPRQTRFKCDHLRETHKDNRLHLPLAVAKDALGHHALWSH